MIAIFTNKQTGQAQIVSQVAEYTELYNYTMRKWYHSVLIIGTGHTILFDSKVWKVQVKEVIVEKVAK